jgi:hypothetical protein
MTLLSAFDTECLSKKLRPARDFAKASKHVAPGHLNFVAGKYKGVEGIYQRDGNQGRDSAILSSKLRASS